MLNSEAVENVSVTQQPASNLPHDKTDDKEREHEQFFVSKTWYESHAELYACGFSRFLRDVGALGMAITFGTERLYAERCL